MLRNIYGLYDVEAMHYSNLFEFDHDVDAVRAVKEELLKKPPPGREPSKMQRWPQSYSLVKFGVFDTEKGRIKALPSHKTVAGVQEILLSLKKDKEIHDLDMEGEVNGS